LWWVGLGWVSKSGHMSTSGAGFDTSRTVSDTTLLDKWFLSLMLHMLASEKDVLKHIAIDRVTTSSPLSQHHCRIF